MSTPLSAEATAHALQEIVTELGYDTKDWNGALKSCNYFYPEEARLSSRPNAPIRCLIGEFLSRQFGISDRVLLEVNRRLIDSASDALGVRRHLTPQALALLSEVQTEQDVGLTWGEALRLVGITASGLRRRYEHEALRLVGISEQEMEQ
jgi:hypothetical protein